MSQSHHIRIAAAVVLTLAAASRPGQAQIEVRGASIAELQQAMVSGLATSEQITQAYLARIRAYDQAGPRINSMIWINANAIAEAEALDQERVDAGPRGPLHGIPIILKDNFDTYDMPTSAGSLALAGNVPPNDAFQVARLREAGAVIIGKANLHEMAGGITTIGSLGGQTLNPYDLRRNPGGSSGGTGAAIAASFAAVGWGTDTCGSIRIPAAQNNLVGLRPTKGLSSVDGIIPRSHTQDTGGPLARTVHDLAVALDATVGRDRADPATAILEGLELASFVDELDASALDGARIGILESFFGDAGEEAAASRVVRRALGEMVRLGAETITIEIPGYDTLNAGARVVPYEFKWDLIDYLASVPNAPVSSLEELLDLGLIQDVMTPALRRMMAPQDRETEEYLTAMAKREPLRNAVEAVMDQQNVDVIVYPTIRTPAAIVGTPQRGSNCALSAHSGLPALSIPAGFTEDGLPIGLEMLGRTLADHHLVAMGYAFEQATDHRHEPASAPPLVNGAAPPPMTVDVRSSGEEYSPARASGVEVRATLTLDPAPNTLAYDVTVTGVRVQDIYAVVLRHPDGENAWVVAHRISGPGESRRTGTLTLGAVLRERLDAGEVSLEVFTRDYPFGAARAMVRFRE